ncbi:hypothetical protein G3I59_07040 [Amycolatopsis rubida]|uniref:Uncharacterized protein n=1 Tax=Amycolatopsis rubida TaxID=112413 RepID=A0ABX0BR98_9PSEU|nr:MULTISPECIES: hypothetical protein [Amycolatopsis]MYW90383.1 hypothetical protein [Amycolatopsis rubida]NEC55360.1 hypothetical protein [Amycolatopsis rubida]
MSRSRRGGFAAVVAFLAGPAGVSWRGVAGAGFPGVSWREAVFSLGAGVGLVLIGLAGDGAGLAFGWGAGSRGAGSAAGFALVAGFVELSGFRSGFGVGEEAVPGVTTEVAAGPRWAEGAGVEAGSAAGFEVG